MTLNAESRPHPYTLAVCAEMVFVERPIDVRVAMLAERGFAAEIWSWWDKDLARLRATGATFTSMTGYVEGELVDPEGARLLLETAERSVRAADELGARHLNLHGTGLGAGGLPVRPVEQVTGPMWIAAYRTLARVAELGRREGVVFTIENLNTAVDHPGTPFAAAKDTRALVSAVDSPHLRMNLDLYHAQIGEGNLVGLVRESLPWVAEVQVADVPGRCEPGTGEINYAAVAAELDRAGYAGVVGMEAFASSDPEIALSRFAAAFTGRDPEAVSAE